jgi:hypothetical protein
VWQSSQTLLVEICVAFLPVALVPLWHEAQLPLIPEWLKRAPVHVLVVWQDTQSSVVGICRALLPVACDPL